METKQGKRSTTDMGRVSEELNSVETEVRDLTTSCRVEVSEELNSVETLVGQAVRL